MSWYGDSPWPSLNPTKKLTIGGTMMFSGHDPQAWRR
jgi:hypothetical protein